MVSNSADYDSDLQVQTVHKITAPCFGNQELEEIKISSCESEPPVASDISPKASVQKSNGTNSGITERPSSDFEIEEDYSEKPAAQSMYKVSSDFMEDETNRSDLKPISTQTTVPYDNFEKKCEQKAVLTDTKINEVKRKSVSIEVSMDNIRTLLFKSKRGLNDGDRNILNGKPRIRFYAEIDPSKNKNAEQELSKEISKDMFSKVCLFYSYFCLIEY